MDCFFFYCTQPNINYLSKISKVQQNTPAAGHMQSVTINTKVEEFRSWAVYSIKHYVIKFVSNLRQAGCCLRELGFLPPI